jgi:hypothetical protein
VPQQFHGKSVGSIALGQSGFRQFDDVMPTAEQLREKIGSSPTPAQSLPSEVDSRPDALPTVSDAAVNGGNVNSIAPDAGESASTSTLPDGEQPLEIPDATISPNIFANIRLAEDYLVKLNKAIKAEDRDETRSNLIESYRTLADIAVSLDSLPKTNPAMRVIRDQMQTVARQIKRGEVVGQEIQRAARSWVNSKQGNGSYGLVMTVQLDTAEKFDQFWIVTASESPAPGTKIVISRALAPALAPGQSLLLMGVVNMTGDGPVFSTTYLQSM